MSTRSVTYSTTPTPTHDSAAAATNHFRAATAALTPEQYRTNLSKVKGPKWAEELVSKVSVTTKRTQATLAERLKADMSKMSDLAAVPSVLKESVPTSTLTAVSEEWRNVCRNWITLLLEDVTANALQLERQFPCIDMPMHPQPELLRAAELLETQAQKQSIYLQELALALQTVLNEVNK
jgi:hypothetical protein